MRSILLILNILLFSFTSNADQIYKVDNIKVTGEGRDLSSARQNAIDKAKITAFKVLLGRLSNVDKERTLSSLNEKTISKFVKNIAIIDESISANNYNSVVNIEFSEPRINSIISSRTEEAKQKQAKANIEIKVKPNPNPEPLAETTTIQENNIYVNIPIDSLKEWQNIKNKLGNLNFVKNINTKYMTSSYAFVKLEYIATSYNEFIVMLRQNNLDIIKQNSEYYLSEYKPKYQPKRAISPQSDDTFSNFILNGLES